MPVTQLEFITQPSDTQVGQPILPAVRVALKDEDGEIVTSASDPVTVSIEDNPGGGTLSGTLTKNAVAGIATFTNLRIDEPGVDYTLRATADISEDAGPDPLSFSSCTEWVTADQPSLADFEEDDPVGLDPDRHWIDRVTGTRYWHRESEARCPKLKLTGGPYLDFTGAADRDLSWSATASTLLSFTGYTMFQVCQPRKNGANGINVSLFSVSYVGIALFNDGSGNKFRHWADSGGGSVAGTNSTTIFTLDEFYIIEAWFDGGRIYIKVNGDAETSIVKSPASLAFNPAIMQGDEVAFLKERITFNADIGADARAAFRTSLSTKYGIPLV
jgi:hypothetical protein